MAVLSRTFFSVLLVRAFCTLISSLAWGAPFEPGRLIPELHLGNGTVLHEVKIVSTGSTTVMATWEGGRGTILLSLLPDDLRSNLIRQLGPKAPARTSTESAPGPAAELDANGLPTRITLNNGFIMQKCEILRWSMDSITVRYLGGTVSVRFSDINLVQRPLFESKRTAALEQQAKDEAAKASQEAKRLMEPSIQDYNAKRTQEQEDHIKEGVASHFLVLGMTMDEARTAYGDPSMTSETDRGPVHFSLWTYGRRSKSRLPDGKMEDVHLQFFDGILESWDGGVMPEQPFVK